MTKTRHILGLSGGKDSAALAIHMNNKHPEIDVEYFFTDTGYELSETYKFLDKLKTRLDKPIHYIQPVNSFDYYMKKYNNFIVDDINLSDLAKLNKKSIMLMDIAGWQ